MVFKRRPSCSFSHEGASGRKAQSSSLTVKARTQTDGRKPSKSSGLRGESPYGLNGRGACKKILNGMRTDASCDYWHPPVCQKYRTSVTIICLDILRLVDGPVKSQRNVVERDQLPC